MKHAILVQGLAFGDEAKGATVDFLCRKFPVDLIVRFNGGSQAAHNVVTPEGVHHTFSQFGSGMLANDRVRTHLSQYMLVDPVTMMNEAEALTVARKEEWRRVADLGELEPLPESVWERTTVDPRCVVITPFHKLVNQLREKERGAARHGSCGMGVGVAREWSLDTGQEALVVGDLTDYDLTKKKLHAQQLRAYIEFGNLADITRIDVIDLTIDYYNWTKHVTFFSRTTKDRLGCL